jgi:hypothetical protein
MSLSKEDLQTLRAEFPTRADLRAELSQYPTKEDLRVDFAASREETAQGFADPRRCMEILTEDMKAFTRQLSARNWDQSGPVDPSCWT